MKEQEKLIPHCPLLRNVTKDKNKQTLTASESPYSKPHFWTRRPSATARPGFSKLNIISAQCQWVGHVSMYGCKAAIAQLCLWPANAENLLNREFLSDKQNMWTCHHFPTEKCLLGLKVAVRLAQWSLFLPYYWCYCYLPLEFIRHCCSH